MKQFLSILLIAILFVGCASDDIQMDIISKDKADKEFLKSEKLQKALDDASALRAEIYGDASATRSMTQMQIVPIVNAVTRSDMDTLYYIVN